MLTRYLLSKTIHLGEHSVSQEGCNINLICLMSVQRVLAHVCGLAFTSTNCSEYYSYLTRYWYEGTTNAVMLTRYLLLKTIHVGEQAAP